MNICCTCDDKYVLPLRVMLESLARYDTDVAFWLVYSDIDEVNLSAIAADTQCYGWSFNPVKIEGNTLRLCESLPAIQYFTKEVYYRLFIPWILRDCDRAIYMDCDTLVRGKISELYDAEMGGVVLGAVPDSKAANERGNIARLGLVGRYYNSGVLLIDCETIRGRYTQEEMCALIADAVSGNDLVYPDQDLINLIFQGRILTLATVWNFTTNLKSDISMIVSRSEMQKVRVIHYIGGTKPWHPEYIRWPVFEYWKHLRNFLSDEEKFAYWKRKRFLRGQFGRIPKKIKYLCSNKLY